MIMAAGFLCQMCGVDRNVLKRVESALYEMIRVNPLPMAVDDTCFGWVLLKRVLFSIYVNFAKDVLTEWGTPCTD